MPTMLEKWTADTVVRERARMVLTVLRKKFGLEVRIQKLEVRIQIFRK